MSISANVNLLPSHACKSMWRCQAIFREELLVYVSFNTLFERSLMMKFLRDTLSD